jgi:tetrahydromethanopterin S-methyltransferase subunit C
MAHFLRLHGHRTATGVHSIAAVLCGAGNRRKLTPYGLSSGRAGKGALRLSEQTVQFCGAAGCRFET